MTNQQNAKKITKEEVFEIVKDSIVSVLECDRDILTMESNFINDLYADSLDRVNLVIAYEDAMKMRIPADMARELRTIEQAVDYLMKRLCEKQSA